MRINLFKEELYMERISASVREPFKIIPEEEIAEDSALAELVANLQPEAVIFLPQFPEVVYLRMQPTIYTGRGLGIQLKQTEVGLYYSRQSKTLIDLESREDGSIQPTDFGLSKKVLLEQRHGIGKYAKK
jgi:hypothetical protein